MSSDNENANSANPIKKDKKAVQEAGNVNVDYLVRVTYHRTVDKTVSIGTSRIDRCIGIIATLTNDKIFCGHLGCQIEPMENNQEIIKEKVTNILYSVIGRKSAVETLHYLTGIPDLNTKSMIEAIITIYGKVIREDGAGIYWKDGKVGTVNFDIPIIGLIEDKDDENGPFNIKQ